MTKKLPVISDGGRLPPSAAQTELSVAPVAADTGSRPEFPRRSDVRRGVGLIAGGALLATTMMSASAKDEKQATAPAPAMGKGNTIDGAPAAKKAPKIMIYRGGGGIGPSPDEYDVNEVEAFLAWKFAKEKLDITTNYSFDHDGVRVKLDGYDPIRNIGYEFFSDNDYDEFNDAIKARLAEFMTQKKAAILLIDISGTPDVSTLSKQTAKFFKDIKKSKPALGMLEKTKEPVRMVPPKILPPKMDPPSKNPPQPKG